MPELSEEREFKYRRFTEQAKNTWHQNHHSVFPYIDDDGLASFCRRFSIHKEDLLHSGTNNISNRKNASHFGEFNRTKNQHTNK